jgi:hypothetical protein
MQASEKALQVRKSDITLSATDPLIFARDVDEPPTASKAAMIWTW